MLYNVLIGKNASFASDITDDQSQWCLTSPRKLLLVEDNETNQLVASTLFSEIGFDVDIASNGLEAVNQAKHTRYDIIFMDLQMPVMDGFEASKTIRTFNSDVPIIALSAAAMQKDQSLTLEAGMQYHIAKPIDKKELLTTIEKYFELTCIDPELSQDESEWDSLIPQSVSAFDMRALFRLFKTMEPQRVYSLYATFKNSFEQVPEQLNQMDTSSDEFYKLIHKLKGASANMQMSAIAERCQNIESEGATQESVKTLQLKLEDSINDINTYILPLLEEPEQTDISRNEIRERVEKIITDIDHGLLITGQDFERFLKVMSAWVDKSVIEELEQSFSENDDDLMLKVLNRLLEEL
jgi:CheY-like chemotaxis protein